MRVLIVHAHPEPKSFNGAMRDLAVSVLTEQGHTVDVSDLYAMRFNAVGGPSDFTEMSGADHFKYQAEQRIAAQNGTFVPEVQVEIEKLLRAEVVIFQFPLWWFSLPAILKGWVDRVFAMGVAYGPGQTYATGPLRGKRTMLALTTGGPEAAYMPGGRNGEISMQLYPIQHGILYFAGMDVLPPYVAWSPVRVEPDVRARYLAEYRERLLALETTQPLTW